MSLVNATQRQRDADARLRNACAACGHDGTTADPLGLDDEGYRVHESHFDDPTTGLYGRRQNPSAKPGHRTTRTPSDT